MSGKRIGCGVVAAVGLLAVRPAEALQIEAYVIA
jgi:hypothetical protein